MHPDLILHNAVIHTCDRANSTVSALAAWQGRLCAVGRSEDVLNMAGPGTRVVDLRGRTVCPGFTDSHVHLASWALVASGRQVCLDGSSSLDEALERIRAAVTQAPPGGWVRGRGWDKNRWPGDGFPTAADLDAVTGPVPAAFASHDGHSVWVNTAAMEQAAITPDLDDPPGGRLLRDDTGRPCGVLQEAAASLVWRHIPEPGLEETTAALREALPLASALGLTAAHNCEGGDALRAVQALRDEGTLPLRVSLYFPAEALDCAAQIGVCSGFGDAWIRTGGIKAFVDGALGSQTAAMLQPYEGGDNTGVLMADQEELLELVTNATRAGLALALHAIGDRAILMALDAFQAVKRDFRGPWPRHRIEHAQHFHPDDIHRCARLEIIASVQPAHLLADIDTSERYVGSRGRWAFPLQSLAQAGVVLAGGSDAPVETMDPLVGFRSALLRRRHDGTPAEGWYPAERLTARQALRAYTIDGAYAGGEERDRGSLEAGKLADFIVLSRDLAATPPEALEEVRVLATEVDGRVVHDPEGVLA